MELTYQSAMVLPAAYAVLSEDEMTYIEGGVSEMQAAVLNFGINLVVNSVRMLGRGALNSAMTGLKEMHDDGMGTKVMEKDSSPPPMTKSPNCR